MSREERQIGHSCLKGLRGRVAHRGKEREGHTKVPQPWKLPLPETMPDDTMDIIPMPAAGQMVPEPVRVPEPEPKPPGEPKDQHSPKSMGDQRMKKEKNGENKIHTSSYNSTANESASRGDDVSTADDT